MLRMVTPHTVPRSYSGVVQSSEFHHRAPPSSPTIPASLRYSVPPPNYLHNPPPMMVGSPQSNLSLFSHSHIPTAAPNSPATPTTPRTLSYHYPMYPFYHSQQTMYGSPLSSSPVPTATFQQHMMHHSPSPFITSTQSPYIVQPISRASPHLGFHPQQADGLSSSFRSGLTMTSSSPGPPGYFVPPPAVSRPCVGWSTFN
eukprot:GFUD01037282.1.p1 GENE.GFUD01037282.1~~GFUD01037282.1.p1  ORF type:complete len:216 (-),score=24.82 GFUD01037282.1:112-711(-)